MCDVLCHRGPDDAGYLLGEGIALGMRRLAIIDLATGRQPVFNEDGTIAVVYNGEIYNFQELRALLIRFGHRFNTGTDTECIVHLYEEYGERCVDHLRGMFAFALWDGRRQRLLLARDRVGKKPLYYRLVPGGIWFGSELKALLQDPLFVREVDPVALHHYLTYQYVPAPWAILRGVAKLPAAHTLTYQDAAPTLRRYWRLDHRRTVAIHEEEAVEELRRLVREATRIRLVADRPLGAFLSGGVDSSIVVAAMAHETTGPVRTFTIGFDERRFDERAYARVVAERFATDHHELVVRPDARDLLPTLVWHCDEPLADASAIPTYYVAAMASREVVVALNGDGGDEVFGGYERYQGMVLAQRLCLPGVLRPVASRLARVLPPGGYYASPLRRAKAFLQMLALPEHQRYAEVMAFFTNRQKDDLYTGELRAAVGRDDSYDLLARAFAEVDARDVADAVLGVDVETYLPGALLVKMDRTTMANSLEARSPLLDQQVMAFAASLPSTMKVRGRTSKYLLKKAARGWVPDAVLDRHKMGFSVPMAAWLRGDLRDMSFDLLTDATATGRGLFDPSAVRRLLDEHAAGRDHSRRIWALMAFELWHRMFIDRAAVSAPPAHRPPVGG